MQRMFNPNDLLSQQALLEQPQRPDQFDFEARQAQIEQRKRLLTDLMRRQTQQTNMPEGRMVGGQYIAPSWAENLNAAIQPALAQWQGNSEQKALQKDVGEYDAADRAAAAAHVASRPQARPELPGPIDPSTGSPELAAYTPTSQEQAAWAQKGAAIPSRREVVAKLLTDLEVNEPVRQEARAEKRQDREDRQGESRATLQANVALRREQIMQQAADAQRRSEDTRLGIEQRREAAREHTDLMKQMSADRRSLIAAQLDAKADKPVKPLPSAVHKELSTAEDNAATMSQLTGSFDDSYSGMMATARNTVAPYDPTGTIDDAGAQWWKSYRKQAQLVERHALFGSALTASEKTAWNAADLNQGMQPDTIKKHLATRERLTSKVFANAVDRYEKGGYPNVRDAFNPAQVRTTGGVTGSWDAPASVPRIKSDADYARLPRGTVFIDPEGKQRTKP